MTGAAPPRATFRDVWAVREFRAVWSAELLSVAGDRLALVALTLLVYDRTGSPLLHDPFSNAWSLPRRGATRIVGGGVNAHIGVVE